VLLNGLVGLGPAGPLIGVFRAPFMACDAEDVDYAFPTFEAPELDEADWIGFILATQPMRPTETGHTRSSRFPALIYNNGLIKCRLNVPAI